MNKNFPVYFIIGTRAQFIKVAPIMRMMLDRKIKYKLIYTAQHRENITEILNLYELPTPDLTLYDKQEANTRNSFLVWFFTILYKSLFHAKKILDEKGIVLTHGDTFTTWLAALMGKRAHCIVGHIESGCRSFNIFSPFPEEISRLITFRLSDIYFCADEWAINNLKKFEGLKVNIGANTIIDGIRFVIDKHKKEIFSFEKDPFVLVSIHRFENIFTKRIIETIVPLLFKISKKYILVFTLHPTTRERLISLNLYDELKSNQSIILHERFEFHDWVRLCSKAEFVISDGGSNQEELAYLGTPTILFRNETERKEGLNKNVVLSKFDEKTINYFINNYKEFKITPQNLKITPSEKIIDTINKIRNGSFLV